MRMNGEGEQLRWKVLIRKTLLLAGLVFVVYVLLAVLFRKQLLAAGLWLGRRFGYGGVALYVYVVDTIIVPTTADVVFPFTMTWNPVLLLTVMSLASAAGGISGYGIARSFNHVGYVQRVTAAYRSHGERLIQRFGAWAVVIAGLTPLPFSTVCWIAGLLRVPFGKVAIASLSRFPRMIIYYLLVKGGFLMAERLAG